MLNSETFARALSDDIKLYNPTNESGNSTHYEDVFGTDRDNIKLYNPTNESGNSTHYKHVFGTEIENVDRVDIENMENRHFQRVFNYPQLDILADTYRSKSQFILALIALLLSFWSMFIDGRFFMAEFISVCPAERRHGYACDIGLSIVKWMFRLVGITSIGVPFMMLLNLGNNRHHVHLYERLGGLLAAVILVILARYLKHDLIVIKPDNPERVLMAYILHIIGYLLA